MNDGAPAPASGPRFVDLHMHSTASDGVLTPEAVVAAAAAANLSAIALTDHDSTAGVERAREAGLEAGIQVVTGVELSAREGDTETHILGLHIKNVEALEPRLVYFRNARVQRANLIVEKLRVLGITITMEQVLVEAGSSAIGRPHIARVLVANGWAPSIRAAFERFLGAGRSAFVPKESLSIAGAIELIHAAGGIAVLAHPAGDGTVEFLTRLKGLGMEGVEVRHPGHSAEDVARLGAISDHLGFVYSGGSDWHGYDAGKRKLGGQEVPWEWMELQLARVRALRAG